MSSEAKRGPKLPCRLVLLLLMRLLLVLLLRALLPLMVLLTEQLLLVLQLAVVLIKMQGGLGIVLLQWLSLSLPSAEASCLRMRPHAAPAECEV